MKIVSNTKDYYDHVANILGVDETLRYERRPFRVEKLFDGSPFIPEFAEFTIPRPVEDDNKIKIQAAGFDLKTSFRKR